MEGGALAMLTLTLMHGGWRPPHHPNPLTLTLTLTPTLILTLTPTQAATSP